ncbi:uncharacterized protein ACNS7B_021667 [Menidia menidia]
MRPLAVTTWVLLCAPLLLSAEQRITTEAGQDSVTLPCGAGKVNSHTAVEWIRPDLHPDGVLFYRDDHFESEGQHPSFRNRVDLQDRHRKDGDASLILKNVTINDAGTYECKVVQGRGNRRKRAAPETTIHLVVSPPGTQEGGGKGRGEKEGGGKEGGVKEGGDEEGGGKEGETEEGGSAGRGHPGLLLGLIASVLGIVAVIAAVLFRKRKKTPPPPDEEAAVICLVQTQSSDNSPPPPEGAPVQPLV